MGMFTKWGEEETVGIEDSHWFGEDETPVIIPKIGIKTQEDEKSEKDFSWFNEEKGNK